MNAEFENLLKEKEDLKALNKRQAERISELIKENRKLASNIAELNARIEKIRQAI